MPQNQEKIKVEVDREELQVLLDAMIKHATYLRKAATGASHRGNRAENELDISLYLIELINSL